MGRLFDDIPDEPQASSGLPEGYPPFKPSQQNNRANSDALQEPSWAERVYNAASPYIPDHLKDYAKESVRSLYEGPRNTAENFAADIGKPTLEGTSGAATTALSMPLRSVTGGEMGFGTAVDAVMNPLYNPGAYLSSKVQGKPYEPWGTRAEQFYDPVEQRFQRENEGVVKPLQASMEATLNMPYGAAGTMHGAEPAKATGLFSDIPDEPASEATPGQQSALSANGREAAAGIFKRSYGDEDGTLAKLLDSPDNYSRNLGQALLESAPKYEEGRTLAAAGKMRPEDDHTPHILRAVDFIKSLREADIAPSDYWEGHKSKHEPDQEAGRWVSILYRGRDLEDPNLSQKINYGLSFHAPYEVQPIARRRAAEATPPAPLVRTISDRLENSPAFKADPAWIEQATAFDPAERILAGNSVDAGYPYTINGHAHDAAHQIISQFEDRLPPGVKIGVLRRVDPVQGAPDIVLGHYSNFPDFRNYARRESVGSSAAIWDPNTKAIMISRYGTASMTSPGQFAHGLQGEIVHEIAHAMSTLDLTAAERNAVITQADNLDVLGIPFSHYAALKLGKPVSEINSRGTVRDAYEEAYKNRTPVERQFVMDEEKIAMLAEFYHHRIIAPSDLSPTPRAILDKIVSSRNVRREQRARGGAVRSRQKATLH
jgi:hypothetical protein